MIKINNLVDLMAHKEEIPGNVYYDVEKRICDFLESEGDVRIHEWIKAGGEATDDYIKKQFKFAEHFLNN